MSCYARACQRIAPCPTTKVCEHRGWHLCEHPTTDLIFHWTCPICHNTWSLHQGGVWHRD